MTNPEVETTNKAEYLKALIASGGPGLVIFAVIVCVANHRRRSWHGVLAYQNTVGHRLTGQH